MAQVTSLTFQLEEDVSQQFHCTRKLMKALTPMQNIKNL